MTGGEWMPALDGGATYMHGRMEPCFRFEEDGEFHSVEGIERIDLVALPPTITLTEKGKKRFKEDEFYRSFLEEH